MVAIYLCVILVMRVVQSIFSKKASALVPADPDGYIKYAAYYQAIAGALAALLLAGSLLFFEVQVPDIGATIVYASISGVALSASCMCTVYILKNGTMALDTLFATAGLLIPVIAGIFLYDESLRLWQWGALGLLLVGVWLLAGSSKALYGKFTPSTWLTLLLSMLSGGLTMLMQKAFGMNVQEGNVSFFSAVSFLTGALTLSLVLFARFLLGKRHAHGAANVSGDSPAFAGAPTPAFDGKNESPATKKASKLPKQLFLFGAVLACAVFAINQFVTMCTPLLSTVVLFAISGGGATFISAAVGAVVFKEKLSVRSVAGLLLGVCALILVQL